MRVARIQTGINHHGRIQAAMKITSKLNTRKHKVAFVFLHVSLQVLMSQFAISKYYLLIIRNYSDVYGLPSRETYPDSQ